MVITGPLTSVGHLRNLVHNIKVIQPKKILVPEVRRASVAIILRVRLEQDDQPISHKDAKELLFDKKLDKGRVEVFYIQRSIRAGDRWSGQVAFPGGKHEPTDKDDLATAVREVHEEVGIDLNASEYAHIGELDDREVTSRFGTKLLMILSTQVFLQLSTRDNGIQADSSEVAQGIWYDFDKLKNHHSSNKWVPHNISVYQALKPRPPRGKVASAPSFPLVEDLLEFVFGRMKFSSIPLESIGSSQPVSHPATLWGLTLGITSELWDMAHPPSLVPRVPLYYPLPRYDYPEVNLLIRLFCKPNPDRKPSTSVVNRRTWDRYFLVLKFGFILVLVNRSLVAIWLMRLLYNYYIKNKV